MMTTATLTLLERAMKYADASPEAVAGQGGHNRTYSLACKLVHMFDLQPEDALSVLVHYNARCKPPWSDRELRHKIESAMQAKCTRQRGHMPQNTQQREGRGRVWPTHGKREAATLTLTANKNAVQARTAPFLSVPTTTPPPPVMHRRLGKSSRSWAYHDKDGKVIGYAVRFDMPDGKTFLPLSWGGDGWIWQGLPEPRPLYGLHRLAANPTGVPLVCEGEKAADAAQGLIGSHGTAITYPNGSGSWAKADWSPLFGRKVILWPDADNQGMNAFKELKEHLLRSGVARVKLIDLPPGLPEKWDAADAANEGWTSKELERFVKGKMVAPDGLCPLCWVRSIAAPLGGPTCKHGKWEWSLAKPDADAPAQDKHGAQCDSGS